MEKGKIIEKLDRVFSEFIRRRDCGKTQGRCISCGALIRFETSQCGHYIDRKHLSTRFDEVNCNAQCINCNMFKDGNIENYRAGLIRKHGLKVVKELEAKKNQTFHMTVYELNELVLNYREKLKNSSKVITI